ncbi:MAG: YceI family protein [Bacteriovoracaceae bacterium]
MNKFVVAAIFFALFSIASASEVVLKVDLSPVGDFNATTTKTRGRIIQKGDKLLAKKLSVNVRNLKTGVKLRDEHLHKKLRFKKYKQIELLNVSASNGKGVGTLKVMGKKKKVKLRYKLKKNKVEAEFKFKLSDFGITGVEYMGVGVQDEAIVQASWNVKKAK